jgi:hypothetical protein
VLRRLDALLFEGLGSVGVGDRGNERWRGRRSCACHLTRLCRRRELVALRSWLGLGRVRAARCPSVTPSTSIDAPASPAGHDGAGRTIAGGFAAGRGASTTGTDASTLAVACTAGGGSVTCGATIAGAARRRRLVVTPIMITA